MAEKSCANPRCTCPTEPGKEFCSSNCREAKTGAPCSCAIRDAEVSLSRSSPHRVYTIITDDEVSRSWSKHKCDRVLRSLATSRMLKKSTDCVLATLRGSTYGTKYDSPLRLLRPCRAAFLNILRGVFLSP
jgi:hypothetical protein